MRALLLSGGVESSALAYWLRPDVCVTVDYGQRPAEGEVAAASAIAGALDLRHEVVRADLSSLGMGELAGAAASGLGQAAEFWAYRNQMLITLAGMRLLNEGLREVILGAVTTDMHADGKPPFVAAMDRLMSLQEGGVRVTAPAIRMTTQELLAVSGFPRELFGYTFSCHVARFACGQCGGCEKHRGAAASLRNAP